MIRSYIRGFVTEFLSMSAVVLGFIAALYFYKKGGEFIRNTFMQNRKTIPEVIAFIVLFITVYVVIKIIEKTLKGIVDKVYLSGIDRFMGIFFGLLEGIAVVSLALFLLRIQPLFDPGTLLQESFFAKTFLPFITGAEKMINV
jgi:membrane protein required for colicin V production